MSSSPWGGALGQGDEDVAAPFGSGVAMSSSPWGGAWGEGDVDVAAPFQIVYDLMSRTLKTATPPAKKVAFIPRRRKRDSPMRPHWMGSP